MTLGHEKPDVMKTALVLLTCLSMVSTGWGGEPPLYPRTILTERTARWEDEVGHEGAEKTVGAESNPTGSPIGGGKGYRDVVTKGDFTVRTLDQLRAALGKAKAGQVVFIPGDAEIDMSDQATLRLPARVTLASCRGHKGSPGARIFIKGTRPTVTMKTLGPYVRVTGIRLQGSNNPSDRTTGLQVDQFGVEIDNCEISKFTAIGIFVREGASRVYAHHNHIHHNWGKRLGVGYGLTMDKGDALVEANIFDHCQHHIASTGSPGSAYEARYNISGPSALSHYFDMHGGRDRGDGTAIAGDWMNIHHNTFQGRGRPVKVRGVCSQGARIHHNRTPGTKTEEKRP
jgi:hypothetical protein